MLKLEKPTGSIYHLSKENLNGTRLIPRVPNNFLVKNGFENAKVMRVSFASSIDGALSALSMNLANTDLYVHIPVSSVMIHRPSIQEVPDVKITDEVWALSQVKIKAIGKIHVDSAYDEPLEYKYGGKYTAALYRWKWSWVTM